jgi:hypothetical protein
VRLIASIRSDVPIFERPSLPSFFASSSSCGLVRALLLRGALRLLDVAPCRLCLFGRRNPAAYPAGG